MNAINEEFAGVHVDAVTGIMYAGIEDARRKLSVIVNELGQFPQTTEATEKLLARAVTITNELTEVFDAAELDIESIKEQFSDQP